MTQEKILAEICRLEEAMGGDICLAARNLTTGVELRYNAERRVKTASVIKLPILTHVGLLVEEGALQWTEKLTLTDEEKVAGSGILTQLNAGLSLTLHDVCMLMIALSDNTGTNMIIERLGFEPINARMRALGLPQTTLFRKSYSPDAPDSESRIFGLGVTTPQEMLDLLTRLATGKIGSPALSAYLIEAFLAKQQYLDSIPRMLPEGWSYAGKTGGVDGVRNDVGIVTSPKGVRWAIAIFCQNLKDLSWTADNAGLLAMAQAGKLLVTL